VIAGTLELVSELPDHLFNLSGCPPAINALPLEKSFARWDFIELAGQTQVADFANILTR